MMLLTGASGDLPTSRTKVSETRDAEQLCHGVPSRPGGREAISGQPSLPHTTERCPVLHRTSRVGPRGQGKKGSGVRGSVESRFPLPFSRVKSCCLLDSRRLAAFLFVSQLKLPSISPRKTYFGSAISSQEADLEKLGRD